MKKLHKFEIKLITKCRLLLMMLLKKPYNYQFIFSKITISNFHLPNFEITFSCLYAVKTEKGCKETVWLQDMGKRTKQMWSHLAVSL